jgi:hypothetical protein
MSEAGYVELPILQWLSGHGSTTPSDHGLVLLCQIRCNGMPGGLMP